MSNFKGCVSSAHLRIMKVSYFTETAVRVGSNCFEYTEYTLHLKQAQAMPLDSSVGRAVKSSCMLHEKFQDRPE